MEDQERLLLQGMFDVERSIAKNNANQEVEKRRVQESKLRSQIDFWYDRCQSLENENAFLRKKIVDAGLDNA